MIKILIKFMISSDGESPGQLVERLRNLGGIPMSGEYDVGIPLNDTDHLFQKLEDIHESLRGSGVLYTLYTGGEEPEAPEEGISTVAPASASDEKLEDMRKKMYRSKLARWKEMGVDTAHLEQLLEIDINKFREESKNFLREHLSKTQVIEDVDRRDLKKIDESVYEQISGDGISLDKVREVCKLSENDAVLSLGRLISAGQVICVTRGEAESYVRVPQHEPEELPPIEKPAPAAESEAEKRVMASIKLKGSTIRQICTDSELPEEQALNAVSDLMNRGLLKSAKRAKSTVYLKINK
jgi:hypothetical protein